MKPPGHPVPSGDRAMACALMAALSAGGHAVDLASALRTWLPDPDPAAMRAVEAAAEREAARLADAWTAEGSPDLWFTYHSYYRAPDLLGPRLAARFGLPYVLAEASQAEKRRGGPWARWHDANERAIRAAAVHVCFTDRDAAGLAGLVGSERITMLPPFLANPLRGPAPRVPPAARLRSPRPRGKGAGGEGSSGSPGRTVARPPASRPDPFSARERGETRPASRTAPLRLVTAAMMRPGKQRSYAILAEALTLLPSELDWHLAVAGDGPARAAVEAAFGALPRERIAWHGALAADALAALFADADLFVWPGFREPFGVVYLEAQAAGLPVLAMASGGVASVVVPGRTGLLVPEGDVAAYAAALARLAGDPHCRERLGREGERMVREERTIARAAEILDAAIARARVAA